VIPSEARERIRCNALFAGALERGRQRRRAHDSREAYLNCDPELGVDAHEESVTARLEIDGLRVPVLATTRLERDVDGPRFAPRTKRNSCGSTRCEVRHRGCEAHSGKHDVGERGRAAVFDRALR
jgi:hypothetical protein